MKKTLLRIALYFAAAGMIPSWCHAQEMAVPIDVQYLIFMKILGFDRNLDLASQAELRIGVIFQTKFNESLRTKELFIETAQKNQSIKVNNRQVILVPLEVAERDGVEKAIRDAGVSVLYVTPLRAFNIKDITAIARANKIVTLTGVPAYVSLGIAMGLDVKGDKPQILVNLAAAKAEGMNLSSQMLKLTKIID